MSVLKVLATWGSKFAKSAKNGGEIINGVRQNEGTVHFIGRHTLGTKVGKAAMVVGGAYGWGKYSGQGVFSAAGDVAENVFLDEEHRGKGAVVGAVRQTLDTAAGRGSAEELSGKVDEAMVALGKGKDAVLDTASGMYHSAASSFSAPPGGMPTMQQYADQQMAYGGYPQQAQRQGLGLSSFNPFNGFTDLLNKVTGGNTNMMSALSLIPAAMLMFGNFGMMGKVASLFLGSFALKHINHPQQAAVQMYQQQPSYGYGAYPQQPRQAPVQQPDFQLAQGGGYPEESNVVHRHRMG